MTSKEQEYQELFFSEAMDNFSEINRLLTILEKNPTDTNAVQTLFRITHTLKGNATGMGFEKVAEMAHVLEDFFGEVNKGTITLNIDLFSSVFKAADVLGALIESIKNPKKVSYIGIKTKLEILIKNATKVENVNNPKSEKKSETEVTLPDIENENLQPSTETVFEEELATNGLTLTDLVQVPVKKLDNLLNLVGELIIERDRILTINHGRNGRSEFSRLNRISSDLQYSVMDVRLVQINFLFNKFHRIVRDAANKENKKVNLILEGAETEIDRNILQVISDSLIHLVRNALSHGIERPEERIKNGKDPEGNITLSASGESGNVIIKIKDDGAGINYEKVKQKAIIKGLITKDEAEMLSLRDLSLIIFEPGFSTSDEVTSLSGRGVGMDVVKKALDSIGGSILVDSKEGLGTNFQLTLPSSMAVKSTLLFDLDKETFAIPLSFTESVISIKKSDIHKAGNNLITVHLEKTIPLVFLNDLFSDNKLSLINFSTFYSLDSNDKLEVVVVSFGGKRAGFVVDKLLQQKEIIEKPLKRPFDQGKFISGLTILGNGNVCLVLNIPGILNSLSSNHYSKALSV
jgi:two-component system, chemotaxis family, sensor kinase CheA